MYVNSSGQLGVLTSSARFKQDIRDMDAASDALLALRLVAYEYRAELDPRTTPQFGLVAEEVEKVCPALVIRLTGAHFSLASPFILALPLAVVLAWFPARWLHGIGLTGFIALYVAQDFGRTLAG